MSDHDTGTLRQPESIDTDDHRSMNTGPQPPPPPERATRRPVEMASWAGSTSIRYSGIVMILLLVVIYTMWLPDVFLTETTLRTIIANQAIIGILALAALIPLIAGLIDLSFGAIAGLSLVTIVYLSIHTALPVWAMAGIAILVSMLFGLISGVLVAVVRLDSFIVTLGVSSIALGISQLITDGDTLYGTFGDAFVEFGQGALGPVPYLTVVLVALAALVWIWQERTPAGRYTMAVGSNAVAARLAGISVPRTQILTLTTAAAVAGLAGVLLAAQVGNGSTTTGPGYLLPVIAGLFLGATQVHNRPNVFGSLIAIFLLGTGIKGLQLAGADNWTTDTFNGVVLLIAVTAAALRSRRAASGRI